MPVAELVRPTTSASNGITIFANADSSDLYALARQRSRAWAILSLRKAFSTLFWEAFSAPKRQSNGILKILGIRLAGIQIKFAVGLMPGRVT